MEIYITCLLQILNFSSHFRHFESSLANHGGQQYLLIGSPDYKNLKDTATS